MTSGHAPNGMIADYAAGALSQGMSLLVASHLTYCPACRDKAARLEALGGALLAEGEAVAPEPRCLKGALARIEAPAAAGAAAGEPAATPLPRPLCQRLGEPLCDLRWRAGSCRASRPAGSRGSSAERVGLMRARPGVRIEPHGHAGLEGTLVLAGAMRDRARTFRRGELALADESVEHAPEAVGGETCLCLVVQTGPAPAARLTR